MGTISWWPGYTDHPANADFHTKKTPNKPSLSLKLNIKFGQIFYVEYHFLLPGTKKSNTIWASLQLQFLTTI